MNRNLFSHRSGGQQSKIRVSTRLCGLHFLLLYVTRRVGLENDPVTMTKKSNRRG